MTHYMVDFTSNALCTGLPPQHASVDGPGDSITHNLERLTCNTCKTMIEKPKGQNTMEAFIIPADPTWEPMEFDDTLAQDGAYAARVTSDKSAAIGTKGGIRVTLELQDADVAGKRLSKFLQDPRENDKVWFLWRGIMRSITGSTDGARAGFTYQPGTFTGQLVYFKVESYTDNNGERRSGVGQWLTKGEYEEIVAKGKHRWAPAAVSAGGRAAPASGTPAGSPFGAFPGLPATVPQPATTAPVQTAPPTNGTVIPPAPSTGFQFPGIKR